MVLDKAAQQGAGAAATAFLEHAGSGPRRVVVVLLLKR